MCQYEPKYLANKEIKRIFFIEKFLDFLTDPGTKLMVIDEMGIGTK